ncbi:SDR family oxidoreductase [Aeromicrobium sp.]|uniref:SDR family oxidoreductase n=1 Tax=Aeromicrobium sp. TaxID=1871063 RepID=UPI003D6A34C0
MDLGLADHVYIVTGATRGLGRATAEVLVAEGARVVISSRSQESVDATVDALGSSAVGVAADNADPGTASHLVAAAQDSFGRLDGALISVGGPAGGPILSSSDHDWRAAFDSVFMGALRLATTVADALPDGGSIAFVLSTSVKEPIPNLGISNGLRPGLAMAAKTLATELGPRGVRVNGLMPGPIDTDRARELDASSGDPAAAKEKKLARVPLGRYGEPEEFGRAAAFMLSPAAGFMTGVMLPVDGGLLHGF